MAPLPNLQGAAAVVSEAVAEAVLLSFAASGFLFQKTLFVLQQQWVAESFFVLMMSYY